jgi:hypothetical protein
MSPTIQPAREPHHPGEHARLIRYDAWPLPNPALIGHCAIAFAGGWCVNAIPIFRRGDGSLSVGVPSAAQLDHDGQIKLKPDGKRAYTAILTFETGTGHDRWQRLVLAALAAAGITSAAEAPT